MSYNNHVQSTLYSAVSSTSTTIQIVRGVAPYQEPPTSGYMTLADSLFEPTKLEIVSYDSFTVTAEYLQLDGVVRGLGGTSAQSFNADAPTYQAVFAGDLGLWGQADGDIIRFEGNVGVGVLPSEDAKLDINGQIKLRGTTPEVGAWTKHNTPTLNWFAVDYGNDIFVCVGTTTSDDGVMTSPNGDVWTSQTGVPVGTWRGVVFGNGLFVTVGFTGASSRVMTSSDGFAWTLETTPTEANKLWHDAAYGDGVYVAVAGVGNAGRGAMTSPDGKTWTVQTTPTGNDWREVTFGDGVFVAVAIDGGDTQVMTSSDKGVTWILRTTNSEQAWYGVAYGKGVFVAVSSGPARGNRSMISSDRGETWAVQVTPSNADLGWSNVVFGNNLFVAVESGSSRVMVSLDGYFWEATNIGVGPNFLGIAYGKNTYVAVAYINFGQQVMSAPAIGNTPGEGKVLTSNGEGLGSWKEVEIPEIPEMPEPAEPVDVQYFTASGIWTKPEGKTVVEALVIGGGGGGGYLGVDGEESSFGSHAIAEGGLGAVAWEAQATPNPSRSWKGIAYGNNIFVAIASSGTTTRVMTSPDGKVWTTRTSAADTNWSCVAFGNGVFVALALSWDGGANQNNAMVSSNGTDWILYSAPAQVWRDITFGDGLFVAVASSGASNRVAVSTNGTSWATKTTPSDIDWESVTYGNNTYVAVASSGTTLNQVMTSPNASIWTIRAAPMINGWRGVAYGNNTFVAVAANSLRAMNSPDGMSWVLQTAPTYANRDIVFGDGRFVAVGGSGTAAAMTTLDGATWEAQATPAGIWYSVAYGNNTFVAVTGVVASNLNYAMTFSTSTGGGGGSMDANTTGGDIRSGEKGDQQNGGKSLFSGTQTIDGGDGLNYGGGGCGFGRNLGGGGGGGCSALILSGAGITETVTVGVGGVGTAGDEAAGGGGDGADGIVIVKSYK